MTSLTKVRFEDLAASLQQLLDQLGTHSHDGTNLPGNNRISFFDLLDIPQEIVESIATLIIGEVPSPAPNGSTTEFTLNFPVLNNDRAAIYLQGVRQTPTIAYTISANSITFLEAPPADSQLVVDYQPVI